MSDSSRHPQSLEEIVADVAHRFAVAWAEDIDRRFQPGYVEPPRPKPTPVPYGPHDIVEMLEEEDTDEDGEPFVDEVKLNAAAEIRRLRARISEMEAGQH